MKGFILLLSILFFNLAFAQTGPRTWRDHLGVPKCYSVSKLGSKIYASNGNGIVYFEEDEKSVQTLNKINGLNDVGVKLLRTNKYNNKLLVIYDNTNIDVIDINGNVSNYSEIKLKALSGKKFINEVTFYNQFAYLACGFGIIVFDTDKMEVKDTYIIGPNGTNIDVYQVALNDSLIFAASELGLYVSNYKTKALNNFNNWKLLSGKMPKGPYAGVMKVGTKVLASYSPSKFDQTKTTSDTLYVLENNVWSNYQGNLGKGTHIRKLLGTYNNLFAIKDLYGMSVRTIDDGQLNTTCYQYKKDNNDAGIVPVYIADVYFDKDNSGNVSYWIADHEYGLYQNYLYFTPHNKINLNGMRGKNVGIFDVYKGQIAVAPSYADVTGVAPATRDGINIYKNKEWSYLETKDADGSPFVAVTSVIFDRKDKDRMWATTWFHGVLEIKNNAVVSTINTTNTPSMPSVLPGEPRCNGLSMDKDGNVWFANSDRINYLSVIKNNKTKDYKSFRFDAQRFTRKTFIDKNNNIWMLHEGNGGITIFKPTNFNDPVLNVNYKVLTKEVGKGNLQANVVTSIAEDQDGKIWIGTSEGISVFYNPTAIFGNGDYDSQPIKIVQDGNVELLLSKEKVLCIAVDGANNKWVGTNTGGLYCFNPDGQTQLYHFTAENSPLYSNSILDITYDEVTGDIFIGSDLGVQSFRSTVLAGELEYTNVVAFPNPVKPGYQGTVLIKGLIDNSIVKIADESGNLVWEAKSTGGQIEWPIRTFAGNRVTSGVYMVYASITNGELKAHTKILVVN